MQLNTKPNISGPDEFYAELIQSHEGLSDDDSAALNARLVLLLANHIGDRDILSEAITAARMDPRLPAAQPGTA